MISNFAISKHKFPYFSTILLLIYLCFGLLSSCIIRHRLSFRWRIAILTFSWTSHWYILESLSRPCGSKAAPNHDITSSKSKQRAFPPRQAKHLSYLSTKHCPIGLKDIQVISWKFEICSIFFFFLERSGIFSGVDHFCSVFLLYGAHEHGPALLLLLLRSFSPPSVLYVMWLTWSLQGEEEQQPY